MDLYEALYTTRAMRRLKPDPIPDEVQARILDAAIRAPNIEQGWRFLLVDDAQIKAQLVPLSLQAFERQVGAPREEGLANLRKRGYPDGADGTIGCASGHHFAEVPKAFRNPVFWGRTAVRTPLRAPLAPPQGALRAGHSRTVQPSETPKRRRNRGRALVCLPSMVRQFGEGGQVMTRIKVLVLALFAVYWVTLVVILVAARDVYDQALPQEAVRLAGNQRSAEIGVLLVATALFAVLSIGVIRGWRWTFWLILVVFLAGILRGLASALQLAGIVPSQDPAWSVVLQAVVYLIQFVIALAMLAGYRKAGVWGAF